MYSIEQRYSTLGGAMVGVHINDHTTVGLFPKGREIGCWNKTTENQKILLDLLVFLFYILDQ